MGREVWIKDCIATNEHQFEDRFCEGGEAWRNGARGWCGDVGKAEGEERVKLLPLGAEVESCVGIWSLPKEWS